MAETFRAPKAVIVEAQEITSDEAVAIRNSQPLSLLQVTEIRASWGLPEGKKWASHVCWSVAQRTSAVTSEELPMNTENRDVADALSLVDLLTQALALANAAAVEEIVEEIEEVSEGEVETNSGSITKDDEMLEERKSAIASAERITMDAEVRAIATDDGTIKIGGYAATFGNEATGLSFREVIAPGAFKRSLESNQPVFLLINHDTDALPLASTQGGTLSLREDATGLLMEATLDPANPRAAELASVLSRGDVSKMSFAFTVAEDGQTRDGGLRTLTDLNLFEVSVVTWPAYEATDVGLRAAQDNDLTIRARKAAAQFAFAKIKK
jgi:HK97 family phage prohead protease